jgi:hypothetical protein
MLVGVAARRWEVTAREEANQVDQSESLHEFSFSPLHMEYDLLPSMEPQVMRYFQLS